MSQWGYEYMSDSQVIMEALWLILGRLYVSDDLMAELKKRINEERQHVPLKVRGEDYNPVENLIRPSCPSTDSIRSSTVIDWTYDCGAT